MMSLTTDQTELFHASRGARVECREIVAERAVMQSESTGKHIQITPIRNFEECAEKVFRVHRRLLKKLAE